MAVWRIWAPLIGGPRDRRVPIEEYLALWGNELQVNFSCSRPLAGAVERLPSWASEETIPEVMCCLGLGFAGNLLRGGLTFTIAL